MLKRYRKWRDRLTSEVVTLGGLHWRVTRRRGRIVGIEQWVHIHDKKAYGYKVWKAGV